MDLPELATERLWLRPLLVDDAAAIHEAYADAACMRFWHHPPTTTIADTREWMRRLVAGDQHHWALGMHGSSEALGHVGFVNGFEHGGHAGFGYLLRRASWGNGFASEASRAALGHGFHDVGIARAELWIQRANDRSVRIAEKVGCRLRSDGPTLVYGITAEQWRGEDDPPPEHRGAEPILGVQNVAAAVEWWVDVLGFRRGFVFGDPPTHAAVLAGPGWTGGPRVQLTQQVDPTPAMVYVVATDLDAAADRALAAGATVVSPLGLRPWGVRELELADPDGHRIRLG
ncbi:MAG TPA: GNAT family N-acetyltransferase [Acidimicrobiales bacterium]|nr:GNAT family N-acetyltransferase [Acidimicrobiales bacterium]